VKKWRRVFAHTAPVFFQRGIASPGTREISSLSMEPIGGGGSRGADTQGEEDIDSEEASQDNVETTIAHGSSGLLATYFEIPGDEFPALAAREAEFELTAVIAIDDITRQPLGAAILCTASTDDAYKARYCVAVRSGGSVEASADACGCVACTLRGFGEPRIWFPPSSSAEVGRQAEEAEDRYTVDHQSEVAGQSSASSSLSVLPCRIYLRHCMLAAISLGPEAAASFLDHTFLADRRTTLRRHLERNPGIMHEEPPASLVDRYSG